MPHQLAIAWRPDHLSIAWHSNAAPDPAPDPAPDISSLMGMYSKRVGIFDKEELLRIYALLDWDVSRFDDVDYLAECTKHLELYEWFDFSLWMSLMKNYVYGDRTAPTVGRYRSGSSEGTIERERAVRMRQRRLQEAAHAAKCPFHTGKRVGNDCERCEAEKQKKWRLSADLPFVIFSDYKKMGRVELSYYSQQAMILFNSTESILRSLREEQEFRVLEFQTLHAVKIGAQAIKNMEFFKLQLCLNLSGVQDRMRSFQS